MSFPQTGHQSPMLEDWAQSCAIQWRESVHFWASCVAVKRHRLRNFSISVAARLLFPAKRNEQRGDVLGAPRREKPQGSRHWRFLGLNHTRAGMYLPTNQAPPRLQPSTARNPPSAVTQAI